MIPIRESESAANLLRDVFTQKHLRKAQVSWDMLSFPVQDLPQTTSDSVSFIMSESLE